MSQSGKTRVFSTEKSRSYSEMIEQVIPGGVNSPFRSFEEVGGHTIFFQRGQGSRLYDIDGNCYLDYLGAWGPAILGHCPTPLIEACCQTLRNGPVFGAPHELELEMAKLVIAAVPSLEKIRFVNSGTEAVMSALRLARGYSKREIIVMFEGAYHGHSDATLCSTGHRSSGGVLDASAAMTRLAAFNDIESVRNVLAANRKQVAAVIVEPVCGSMGVVPPQPGFLQQLEKLCREENVLLIFDEVLTGFRVAFGGAQNLYDVTPDITCFGKALGGGMPIGAYGARAELMDHLQPIGDVYQAGTFSGNPVTMAGGIATLKALADPLVYQTLESRAAQLFEGLDGVIKKRQLPVQLQRVGSMFAVLFSAQPVHNFQDSKSIDAKAFAKFFHNLLGSGIYFPPSSVDAACVSSSHTEEEIEETVRSCQWAFH